MAPLTQDFVGKQDDWDDEEFPDEQIKALLQRADQRLSSGNAHLSEWVIVGAQMSQKSEPMS